MNEFDLESNLNKDRSVKLAYNSSSIKGKLTKLDKNFDGLYKEVVAVKDDVLVLKAEKDKIQEDLIKKTNNVKSELSLDLEKVEKEMKLHFIKQKQENVELQKKLSELKTKKTILQNQLIALQRRINDLETQVGYEDVKFS